MNAEFIYTILNDGQISTNTIELTSIADYGEENNTVNLYPYIEYQTVEGFGGALTEAAAYTYSKMGDREQQEFLDAYFGPEGNRYRFVRMSVDSCDFSLGTYSAVEDEADVEFKSFSLERDEKYILPLLHAAENRLGGKLDIMLTPWSPPAFMKTNGERKGGGKLKPEYRGAWAKYICRFITEYRKLGFNVTMLSIQNEPKAVQTWDSCIFTAKDEMEFLRDYLHPELQANGLSDMQIFIWDHNKERLVERAREVITPETESMISGIAFHWYSGDHFEALDIFSHLYPDKKLVFSEACIEYSKFEEDNQIANARMYAHDMIGNLNAGMNLWFDWNILLDEKGGPNHVGNFCDAPIMFDTQKGMLKKNLSYAYIRHFSQYIAPDAVRIGISKYTDTIDTTALKNQDGTITIILLNKESADCKINIRISDQIINTVLPADSIATVLLRI